jgi:predicted PurR-regulated permease PerM
VDSKDIALIVWVVIIFAGSIALLGGWGLLVGAVLAALYLRWMGASRE